MQQFFNQTLESHKDIPRNPSWDYVHAGLTRNLTAVLRYYQTRPFSVKSNHILCRLLNSLGVSYNHNLDRFYDIADAKSLNLGMTFKMTSSIHTGILHDGLFYGPGTKEIIIATNDGFDPYYVDRHWRSTRAVEVIAHPRSDLDMLLPAGRDNSTDKGIAVIVVNVAMLAVQFRAFMNDQVLKTEGTGNSPLTTAQFVHMFVLSNMAPSHLDCSLFNRAYNLVMGAPMGESLARHRFPLIDYTQRVDKVYSEMNRYLEKNDKDYLSIMDGYPLVTKPSVRELSRLPDQAPTRQLAWAEVVARIKTVDWLTSVSQYHGQKLNGKDNNFFIKEFLRHRSDRTLDHALDADTHFEVVRTIRDIANRVQPKMTDFTRDKLFG